MTSKDKLENIQGFSKKLSGEDQFSISGEHKDKDRTTNVKLAGVTYLAPFTMNSNDKFKDKRVDKDILDNTASEGETEIPRINAAINSVGSYMYATKRCLQLECEPVVDILSVRLLYSNSTRNEPRKISGVIFVFDDRGKICFIYEQDKFGGAGDLELAPFHCSGGTLCLSIRGPDDIMSMHSPNIFVNIKDYVTGEVIVKGFAQLSVTADTAEEQNHSLEQFRTVTIAGNGNGCSAVVEYLALTYGVFAHVEVELCGGGGGSEYEEGEDFLVYGKISVDYNLYPSGKGVNSITLFEIKEDSRDFEVTTLDSPITLSRSVVAVPAYSSLIVRVDLWSQAKNVPIVQGSFAFDTDIRAVDEIIPGLNCTNAKVTVNWKQPPNQGSTPRARHPILPCSSRYIISDRLEVFSLFIGHRNGKDLSLYGTINFCGWNILNIFGRDKNDPYILSRGCNFLPLQIVTEALVPIDFSHVSVDLEDVEGLMSIKGFITIDLRDHLKERRYDRLLCSVLKGVDKVSFAALHYTVFSRAVRAKLKVQFHSASEHFTDTCTRIHGGLVLRYGGYGTRTQYEKIYHRCVLFERHKQNPLEKLGSDFALELSRSVFVVPCNSSVIIVADLSCCSSTGFTAYLRETTEFQIGTGNVTIDGDEFSLKIAVEWR